MSLTSIITPAIIALVIGLMLANAKKKPDKNEEGDQIIKSPKIFIYVGPLCIALMIVALFQNPLKENEIYLVVFMFITLGSLSLYLTLYGLNFRAIVGKTGIGATSFLGKSVSMNWEEISSVKFIRFRNELRIKSANGKIYVSMYLRGYHQLIEQIEVNTSFTKESMKIPNH